jgi:hypothetical protein
VYVRINSGVTTYIDETKTHGLFRAWGNRSLASSTKSLKVWMWNQIAVGSSIKPCPIHTWRSKIPEKQRAFLCESSLARQESHALGDATPLRSCWYTLVANRNYYIHTYST